MRRAGQRKASDGREKALHMQESDRLLMLEGIRGTALAVAQAASPMERATLDPDEAAEMRRIAAKVIQEGSDALDEEQAALWAEKKPRAMMCLHGVQRLKAELEALEAHVHSLVMPDEEATRPSSTRRRKPARASRGRTSRPPCRTVALSCCAKSSRSSA